LLARHETTSSSALRLPHLLHQAVADLPCNVLLDGEAIGDTLHVFDILEAASDDLRQTRYLDRLATLLKLLPLGHPNTPWVSTAIDPNDKVEVRYLYAFRESGSIYQPFYLGKRDEIPAEECTVDQLKYKAE